MSAQSRHNSTVEAVKSLIKPFLIGAVIGAVLCGMAIYYFGWRLSRFFVI